MKFGLSSIIVTSTLAVFGSVVGYVTNKSNLLKKLTFKNKTIKGGKLIYIELQGTPKKLSETFHKAYPIIIKQFKSVRPIVISFDSKNIIEDEQKQRFIIGFIIDDTDLNIEDKIDDVLMNEKQYRYKELHDFGLYYTEWPINFISIFTVKKAFKEVDKYLSKNDSETYRGVGLRIGVWENQTENVKCGAPMYCDLNHLDFCSIPKYKNKQKIFLETSNQSFEDDIINQQ